MSTSPVSSILHQSPDELKPALARQNPAFVNNQSTKRWCAVAIIIGVLMIVVIGGLGAASVIQAHNIQTPHWLEWLKPVSQTPGAWGSWTLTFGGGALIGGTWLAVGVYSLKKALSEGRVPLILDTLQDNEWQTLNEMVILNEAQDDRIMYDLSDELEKYNDKRYLNGTVNYETYEDDTCCFFIKNFNGNVFPTIMTPFTGKTTKEISDFLMIMNHLGYDITACQRKDDNAKPDGE